MTPKKFPKTLVTGCDGMVGSYIDFGVKTDKTTLDVTDLDAVLKKVRAEKPKVIEHLSALLGESPWHALTVSAFAPERSSFSRSRGKSLPTGMRFSWLSKILDSIRDAFN